MKPANNLTRVILNKMIIGFLLFLMTVGLILFLRKPKPFKPNILLITIDTLRADHLSCYGYKRNTSPNIDKMAKEGILFTNAISQGSWTGISLLSLMNSAYPHKYMDNIQSKCPVPLFPTLAILLKKAGYYTISINGHRANE